MPKLVAALIDRAQLLCEGFRWGVYACMSTTDEYALDYIRKFGAQDLADHSEYSSEKLIALLDKLEAAKAKK